MMRYKYARIVYDEDIFQIVESNYKYEDNENILIGQMIDDYDSYTHRDYKRIEAKKIERWYLYLEIMDHSVVFHELWKKDDSLVSVIWSIQKVE